MLGCVTMRSFLCRCRIMVVFDCPRRGVVEESLDHLILYCPLSKDVLTRMVAELNLHFILPV